MGEGAFANCDMLGDVTFSNAIQNIPKNSFSACNNLIFIKIPDSVINIGYEAFFG